MTTFRSLFKRGGRWGLFYDDGAYGVHVVPLRDLVGHEVETVDCVCGPDVEFVDPDDGHTYPSGPLVVHHSIDGREGT